MRVELQDAIEGAPALILADGEGGVTFHLITDEVLGDVATRHADENGWNAEERDGLYVALIEAIEKIGVTEETPK